MKKSQITLFIILGIVIAIIFGFHGRIPIQACSLPLSHLQDIPARFLPERPGPGT